MFDTIGVLLTDMFNDYLINNLTKVIIKSVYNETLAECCVKDVYEKWFYKFSTYYDYYYNLEENCLTIVL